MPIDNVTSNWKKAYEGDFLDASSWNSVSFWFEFQNNILSHHKVFTNFNLFCKTLVSLSVICIFKRSFILIFTPTDVFLLDVVVIDVV